MDDILFVVLVTQVLFSISYKCKSYQNVLATIKLLVLVSVF